jgi:DNA-directed RNA polymerase specialized sigma24 family protein
MNGNQLNPPSAPLQPSGIDAEDVRQAETPIVACLSRNDPDAAVEICRQLYAFIAGRYCMAALGDAALSNRVLLDTWVRLADELRTADHARTMRSTVLGLVRRRCAYVLETQKPPLAMPPAGTGAEMRGSAAQCARSVLARLQPSDRETLILRYVCDLTYAEVGTIWGIAESEARLRVSNALATATRLSDSEVLGHG